MTITPKFYFDPSSSYFVLLHLLSEIAASSKNYLLVLFFCTCRLKQRFAVDSLLGHVA